MPGVVSVRVMVESVDLFATSRNAMLERYTKRQGVDVHKDDMLRRSLAGQYATLDRSSESYGLIWIDILSRRFAEVLLEHCLDL
jgi:hypothetical protein